ncbi:hypothetical protein PCANC_08328 [Puccinia coronata f. sp. avenae]|uniref:Uncharacterized protein n=1 Tax=Puccinia coronata f. sp. avenae TaxID=200324 RepID=A0A2N5T4K9_9BASI|nr:hypothetical protein PCANC_08328 [Puccinia coronata f. sp. avenae]
MPALPELSGVPEVGQLLRVAGRADLAQLIGQTLLLDWDVPAPSPTQACSLVNNKLNLTQDFHQTPPSPHHTSTTPVAVKIEAEIEAAYASINNTLFEEYPAPEASGSSCPE